MKTAIIGGGAAGFMAAITAARTNPKAKVYIVEATHRPLDKVRISGGGRCNVIHHCFDPTELIKNYPRGGKELLGPYNKFGPSEVIEWFRKEGIELKAEQDGRMFPVTDNSQTVIDCLLMAAKKSGVSIQLGRRVKNIVKNTSGAFELSLSNDSYEMFDTVLVSTGNSPEGYRFAESTGHKVLARAPSLFTFKIQDDRIGGLSGVSFENVQLSMHVGDSSVLKQTGPMLITHWGLSGPAVLKLSAWGAAPLHNNRYKAKLFVNFLPDHSADQVAEMLLSQKEQSPKKQIQSSTNFKIPSRFWKNLVAVSGIDETTNWSNLSKKDLTFLQSQLTKAEFQIRGKGIFKEEFVTCGGVDLREINFKTMESKHCPGIFFAGEVLNIDGITGGFNFQSAWTTGWIAGNNLVRSN